MSDWRRETLEKQKRKRRKNKGRDHIWAEKGWWVGGVVGGRV